MRIFPLATIAALTLGVIAAGSASAQSAAPHKRVLGYQDEQGHFHKLKQPTPDATIAPTTGTFEITFNIKVVSSFPKGTVIGCETDIEFIATELLSVSPYEETLASYSETGSKSVSPTGSTATCTVTIPYSWVIPTLSSSADVVLSGGYVVTAIPLNTASDVEFNLRSSSSSFLDATKVPATGTISKYTVNVTI